jgi:Tfp pilus assembly protein PilF
MNNLGRLYADSGQYEKAEDMYKNALAGFQANLGMDHRALGPILLNYGGFLVRNGRDAEGRALLERAAKIDK